MSECEPCRRSFHLAENEVSCSWGPPAHYGCPGSAELGPCGWSGHPSSAGPPALCLTAFRVGRAGEVGGQGVFP